MNYEKQAHIVAWRTRSGQEHRQSFLNHAEARQRYEAMVVHPSILHVTLIGPNALPIATSGRKEQA